MATKKTIDALTEQKIRALANSNGFTDTPLRSEGTHQIELQKSLRGNTEYIYIDRRKGVTKQTLHVVLRSEVSDAYASSFRKITSVQQHMNTRDPGNPVLQSSQYKNFKNKLPTGGEFRGHAWTMPSDDGLQAIEEFLTALV